jgi:hypothetical protein
MENDLQVKYDSLCYATFLNIKHLTADAKRIVLKNVDWNNEEHKFVIHIINACYNILGEKEVAIDVGPFTRSTIAHECRALGKIRKPQPDEDKFVDVPELLEFMRGAANELCGIVFTFGDIYDAYYSGKENI